MGLFERTTVPPSVELERVRSLPLRDWRDGYGAPLATMVELLTAAYRRPGGTQTLRPVQAAMLSEAHDVGGGLFPVGVGEGKTLPSFLLPKVFEAKRPLLIIPAKLITKTNREYEALQAHWVLPRIRIVSYEFLSREQNATYLDDYAPDLIIPDEGHKLKNPRAAVTRRVQRYIRAKSPKVVILSGTITKRSVMDYWHLLRWCLGDEHTPLPIEWAEAMTWGMALDVATTRTKSAEPGALLTLCTPAEQAEAKRDPDSAVEIARIAYQRRLTGTPGVVSTVTSSVSCSIYITALTPDMSAMAPHFKQLREKWETPDGHPFSDAVELWRHARELACGFYYRWNPRPPLEWLSARKEWCKYVREVLKHSRVMDTELQVTNAVKKRDRGDMGLAILEEWQGIKDTFTPNLEAVWCDDTALKMAAEWLHHHVGLCWVEHRTVGERLAKLSGCRYYGQGGLSSDRKNIEDEKGPCIVSIAANGEGRNLQRYSKNLTVSCPPNGLVWEQKIGRTHRTGQDADEVTFEVMLASLEQWSGFQKALSDAAYIQQTTGQRQRLLMADLDIPSAGDIGLRPGPLWG